jgi:hypothetical protein
MKQPGTFIGAFGIGAALVAALGAVSFLVKTGLPGDNPRSASSAGEITHPAPTVKAQPIPPPPDFLDLCRSAGL